MYIGHRKGQDEIQALSEHLANVSVMAGSFGASFDAEQHAQRIGTLHDAGKYSSAAQKRMADPGAHAQGRSLHGRGENSV